MTQDAAAADRPHAAVSDGPHAAGSPPPHPARRWTTLPAGVATALLMLALLLPGVALAGPAAAATVPAPTGSGGLMLTLSQVTPRIVTSDGPSSVTVVGTLRNSGDRPVDDLEIRLQRGDALRTDGDVRDALAGSGPTGTVAPDFVPLPGALDPGGELPVQLTVPLRGAPQDGLALTRPGVYEMLVNVNGVPRDGVRARLVAQRLLLPVLSLPPGPDPDAIPAVPAPAGAATGLTVLYPLADTPHRLPTVPGEQTLLADDDLAQSLAPTGRLGSLVTAYAERAPEGSPVRTATCLAIDPDLVATVAAMRQGYTVRASDGTTGPGTGSAVAGSWLDALTAAARGGCVVALPFADADLTALTRGSLGELARLAVADGATVLADTLGTPVVPATTWPGEGVLDEQALDEVAAAGGRAVVLSADAVDGDSRGTAGAVPLTASSPMLAVLTDPLLTRAASAGPVGTAPDAATVDRTAGGVSGPVTSTAAGASAPLSTQDALAALVFRTQAAAPTDGPLVLAPPHRWITDVTGARALLDGVDLLLSSGASQPRALAEVVAAGPTGAPRRPADPLQVDAGDTPASVVASIRDINSDVVDLQSAAIPETGVGASPDATFTPLLQAALRPASSAWHDRPQLAAGAAAVAADRIAALRGSIRVLAPPSPYSLGTRDAPLLVTVANGLPVTMEVRLSISATTGLRTGPIPPQRIPPLGRRQVQVNAEVVRSGQFVVEATVRTPAGRTLGPPSRLQVRSTAYGTITVWLTGCAGGLLVVLAAYRVVRRIRGEPSRRGRVGPSAGPASGTRHEEPTAPLTATSGAGAVAQRAPPTPSHPTGRPGPVRAAPAPATRPRPRPRPRQPRWPRLRWPQLRRPRPWPLRARNPRRSRFRHPRIRSHRPVRCRPADRESRG